LDLLGEGEQTDKRLRNAYGVCLLRCGQTDRALKVFGGLIFPAAGAVPLAGVPMQYKVNFAAALLVANRISEATRFLGDFVPEENAGSQALRTSIVAWEKSLSILQRQLWRFGLQPGTPLQLDLACLGEL